jgi:hypothetical protein
MLIRLPGWNKMVWLKAQEPKNLLHERKTLKWKEMCIKKTVNENMHKNWNLPLTI